MSKPLAPKDAPDQKRTIVLAVVAGLLLVVFAVKLVQKNMASSADVAPAGHSSGSGNAGAAASPAPIGEDQKTLEARYKPILDADPFHERPFKRREAGRAGGPKGDEAPVASSSSGPAGPGALTLRLTGIVTEKSGTLAIFEDRGTGKGIFLKKGDKVGLECVADVASDTLVLMKADLAATTSAQVAPTSTNSLRLKIGDKLDVAPDDVASRLSTLGPPVQPASVISGQQAPIPTLTAEQKDDVLAKLRAKRKASIAGSGGP